MHGLAEIGAACTVRILVDEEGEAIARLGGEPGARDRRAKEAHGAACSERSQAVRRATEPREARGNPSAGSSDVCPWRRPTYAASRTRDHRKLLRNPVFSHRRDLEARRG
jgi:hypothetical protein